MCDTAARATPSIGVGIVNFLLFENRADVPLAMQNANHHEYIRAQQVINSEFVKSLHRPRAKIAERPVSDVLGSARLDALLSDIGVLRSRHMSEAHTSWK